MDREAGENAARKALIDISIGGWRFPRVFGRLLDKLDASEATRYGNQARYFQFPEVPLMRFTIPQERMTLGELRVGLEKPRGPARQR
ncbi:hypothetical protein AX768_02145 [Burkholderia sp. PAMC 28687]|uniref:hypothetical protein n=1 Tax=Burkholderia sp. PAMC 28687 TaxID=1795874 RepID=UPI0007815C20|nr:hypothetical protein [Burkholderia sp. PAMC 28687]AMM13091.1 hypothetical protein AX768_02145 [Burkholderia sp. PAMC 28687]